MKIRVPGLSGGADSEGFKAVVSEAAQAAGIADHEALRVMTHLLEAIADNVSRGKIITIPGFGKFAPVYVRHFRRRAGLMRPRFSPCNGFMNQVRVCCPITTKGNVALKIYQGNHYNAVVRPSDRPFKALQRIRDSIASQMAQGD